MFNSLANLMPGPQGGTPYNGLYGDALPERGTFFRLQVYKRVGISRVEVYMLQVNLFLRSICFNLGQFVPTLVNLFQPRSVCSNLGQFVST